jgi:hypothetical protein
MVYIAQWLVEVGSWGDAVCVRVEKVRKGGAGSQAADAARDAKLNSSSHASGLGPAKIAIGGSRPWKSSWRGVINRGGEGSEKGAGAVLRRFERAAQLLRTAGGESYCDSLAGEEEEDEEDFAHLGAKLKPEPSGLKLKKLLAELVKACQEGKGGDDEEEDDDDDEEE